MNYKRFLFVIGLAPLLLACSLSSLQDSEKPLGWETYSDENVSFYYPADFDSAFISGQKWPPAITVSSDPFSCKTESRKINSKTYCIHHQAEGTAGSTYVDSSYTTLLQDKKVGLELTLGFPQCLNYDEAEKDQCLKDQPALKLDEIVDQIVKTIRFSEK